MFTELKRALMTEYFHVVEASSMEYSKHSGIKRIPTENGGTLCEIAKAISMRGLEKERAKFGIQSGIRRSLMNHVIATIENSENALFSGNTKIEKIGSCTDGSKTGHLDEFDTLFVMDKNVIKIGQQDGEIYFCQVDCQTVHNSFAVRELVELFAEWLDEIMSNARPPSIFECSGYAAPEFSGVRINGPAVTIQFHTSEDVGDMKKGTFLTVDVTLALPCEESEMLQTSLSSWVEDILICVNNNPIEEPGSPHFVPNPKDNGWQPSTACVESNILYALNTESPLKKAHLLSKALIVRVKKLCLEKNIFPITSNSLSRKAVELLQLLEHYRNKMDKHRNELRQHLNNCMRYGHQLLPCDKRKDFQEPEKQPISVNTTAVKHTLFCLAIQSDYNFQVFKAGRVFYLMKETAKKFSSNDSLFVEHSVSQFPAIGKFSLSANVTGHIPRLVNEMQHLYEIIADVIFCDVSTVSWMEG